MEDKQVVAESTPDQIDVNTVSLAPDTTVTEPSTEPIETLANQVADQEVDEKGVPYKNRFHEMERKYNQVVENIPQIIQQTLNEKLTTQNQTQQPKKQEYSIRELEEFAIQNPDYRGWAEEEKAKLNRKLSIEEFEKISEGKQRVQNENLRRQQSFDRLTSEFSDLFVQDPQGRKIWDNSNPIVREVAVLMQDPKFQEHPEGLHFATLAAYGKMAKQGNVSNAKKESKLKAEVKTLQKKTFVEGGQKSQVVAKDEVRDAIADLKKTGSKKAVSNAVSAYFKKAGYIQ